MPPRIRKFIRLNAEAVSWTIQDMPQQRAQLSLLRFVRNALPSSRDFTATLKGLNLWVVLDSGSLPGVSSGSSKRDLMRCPPPQAEDAASENT